MPKGGRKALTGTVPSKLGNRTNKALKRLEKLTEQYEAQGLSKEEAKKRALETMRDNGRGDWRAG